MFTLLVPNHDPDENTVKTAGFVGFAVALCTTHSWVVYVRELIAQWESDESKFESSRTTTTSPQSISLTMSDWVTQNCVVILRNS